MLRRKKPDFIGFKSFGHPFQKPINLNSFIYKGSIMGRQANSANAPIGEGFNTMSPKGIVAELFDSLSFVQIMFKFSHWDPGISFLNKILVQS